MNLSAHLIDNVSLELGLRNSCFLHIILSDERAMRYQNILKQSICFLCTAMTWNTYFKTIAGPK